MLACFRPFRRDAAEAQQRDGRVKRRAAISVSMPSLAAQLECTIGPRQASLHTED